MMVKLNLLCLPYAGGSAHMYHSWRSELADDVNIVPIELSGRGTRMNEPLYENCQEATEDIYNEIKKYVHAPFAILGHSMGSALAFKIATRMIEEGNYEPEFMIMSGKNPPHIPINSSLASLNDTDFLEEVTKLGGMKEEFLQHQELVDLFLPILKSDFKIVESCSFDTKITIHFDIHILYGLDDQLTTKESLEQWNSYTTKKCYFQAFQGNHFFIEDHKHEVMSYIKSIKTIAQTF